MNVNYLIDRDEDLFSVDMDAYSYELREQINNSSFLVIGGAGSIGQSVVKEIFKLSPLKLYVVDISENELVELVREIRSELGYIQGDFKTFSIDVGGVEFKALLECDGPFDYVLNLSALKHVRGERDPFTLMRMIQVNITNTISSLRLSHKYGAKKYFCVSTDKAANPVNMMGASKSIMEMFLVRESLNLPTSTARFANVAFSNGSLLYGFEQRFKKFQPIAVPLDIKRYFITSQESGRLCLFSAILGGNREIFFPKMNNKLQLIPFKNIAIRYLLSKGFEPFECSSEVEARERAKELIAFKKWPCYFFSSDTSGEKEFEEFFTQNENINLDRFIDIGVISRGDSFDCKKLTHFEASINALIARGVWRKEEIIDIFNQTLVGFNHYETGRHLDQKM